MHARLGVVLAVWVMAAVPALAEVKLNEIEIAAGQTYAISMRSASHEILHVALLNPPSVATGAKVIALGQEGGMEANCAGPDCRGNWTLFCSKAGTITGYVKNLQAAPVKVALFRVECEGKDKQTLMCPTDPRLAARACR